MKILNHIREILPKIKNCTNQQIINEPCENCKECIETNKNIENYIDEVNRLENKRK